LTLTIILNLSYVSGFHRPGLAAFASIPSEPNEPIANHETKLGPGDVPIDVVVTVTSPSLPLWKLAVAGGLATMMGDAALHPMDCIKTIQQSDEGLALSLSQAAGVIWTTSGVAGFYRGLGAYVITDGLGGMLKFGTYEKTTTWCRTNLITQGGFVLSVALLVCAAVAFLASSVILVPGEFVKQQLQMSHYDTMGAAVQDVLAKDGILGFYAGYDGVCLRDIPYTVLELGLYDAFKGIFQKRNDKQRPLDVWQEICAAGVAGGITAYITTPLDTIKTKLMVDSYDAGFWDCLITTIDQYGVGAVFAGALARVAWIVPFTALYLPLYELFKRRLADTQAELS
jgi:solute carrier family 25 S-adenosylmethionine transporter 26